jgi:hypothetical protein
MVGSSKRFTDPLTYAFSLGAYATFDGGQTWMEAPSLTLLAGWAGTSDPAVAFDDVGNAFLVGLPFGTGTATDYTGPVIGIAVYQSTDWGRTWSAPNLIHTSPGDDKQWAAGDVTPGSLHHGNVYAAWDDGSNLRFARTTDHGFTWRGAGADPNPGTSLANDSFAPEISVAADGTVYIVWVAGTQVKFVKSTDGGDSFSAPKVAASGITLIPAGHFPGATFRVFTLPTGCTGTGSNVVFAWADYRDGVSHIYYRHSPNGGSGWNGPNSGQRLLTGGLASAANQHEFHPQLINTPGGEIGCAFYEYGPKGGGEFPPSLIDVVLAVSTNSGVAFSNRATVTEQAWDPTVDEVYAHGNPSVTFIGDYFGHAASDLGFFPFWTDTRTGVQEIFTARLAVNPADNYIRDALGDVGDVPSVPPGGVFWESPDIIVRRQPDGDVHFVNQDLLRDGVTDHYVYGRATNRGPNDALNVTLAVTVGNFPSLLGLPGSEFWYPMDWYPGDWNTPALQNNHLYLGESPAKTVHHGATMILGPVKWPAAQIPPPGAWHPCLLGEVRSSSEDSAGGVNGCDIVADPADPCPHGSFVIGNNNACQRNLNYASGGAAAAAFIELPFLVGSVWSKARLLEVIVDKGHELASVPMILRMESVCLPGGPSKPPCQPGEIVFTGKCRVVVRVGDCDVGDLVSSEGTIWRPICPPQGTLPAPDTCHGGKKVGKEWLLTAPRAAVGFSVEAGEMRRMTLSFTTPDSLQPGTRTLVRIFQRKDKKTISGGVTLELTIGDGAQEQPKPKRARPKARR